MSIPAHLKYIVLSILFVLATVNFTRTTISIIESSRRLDTLKNSVTQLEAKKAQLNQELSYKKTDLFVEAEARNKLNMVKEGEEVYIYPESAVLSASSDVAAVSVGTAPSQEGESNFNRWIDLLF